MNNIPITGKFKPKGIGGFALLDAEDVEFEDGTRLSEKDFSGIYIGSGEMPKGCNVQIDPSGESFPAMLYAVEKDIIPEQELAFMLEEDFGIYVYGGHNLFNITSIQVGEKYTVVWGEDVFESTATEGSFNGFPMIGIGNTSLAGGENNNMPFAIGYITTPDDGESQYSCTIASLDGSASKNVRVYQIEGYKLKESYIPDLLYTQIDQRIEDYINDALGGDY